MAARHMLSAVAAAALLVCHPVASALTLGKLTVQSALGEPLVADVEVTSLSADEAASLKAVIAPSDVYRSAGVDFSSALVGAQAKLMRRSDGSSYVRVTGDRSISEPFLDLILNFSWSGNGQLRRSYTLLIDPRPLNRVQPSAPVALSVAPPAPMPAPVSRPVASQMPQEQPQLVAPSEQPVVVSPQEQPQPITPIQDAPQPVTSSQPATPVDTLPPSGPMAPASDAIPVDVPAPVPAGQVDPGMQDITVVVDSAPPSVPRVAAAPRNRSRQPRQSASVQPMESAAAEPATGGGEYVTKAGDSLARIAQMRRAEGVSLDQMLVSLYHANQDAFVGNNMNRLRAGAVLTIPDTATVRSMSSEEARRVVRAHSADFAAFRQSLAGAVPVAVDASAAPSTSSSGRVDAAVEDRVSPSSATDASRLVLSGRAAKPGPDSPEARASKQAENKASEEKRAELSRNVAELGKLVGSGGPAAGGGASAPASAPAGLTALPVTPVEPPASAVVAAVDPASAAASAAPEAASGAILPLPEVTASAPVGEVPASGAASEAASQPPAATPAPVTAPPAEEDDWMAMLSDFALPIGAGLVTLLLGWGAMRWWRRRRDNATETSFSESKLQADSFFGASGGQRVDTRESSAPASSSLSYSLSQLDAIGDVDPVAEADVYLAYGRDLQAEEILKEALRTDPHRLAIRMKLLEVYAKREDVRNFDAQMEEVHEITGGLGEEWEHALELGRSLDPANPQYQVSGLGAVVDLDSTTDGLHDDPTPTLPSPHSVSLDDTSSGLELDIDLSSSKFTTLDEKPAPVPAPTPMPAPVPAPALAPMEPDALEFDLPAPVPMPTPVAAPVAAPVPAAPAPAPSDSGMLELSMDDMLSFPPIGSTPPAPAPAPTPAPAPEPAPAPKADHGGLDFDFSSLSLDLGLSPTAAPAPEPKPAPAAPAEPPAAPAPQPAPAPAPAPAAGGDMDMLTFDLSGIDLPAFNTAPTPAPVSVSAPDPLPVAAPAPAPVPVPEPIPVAEPTMMELDFDIPPTNVEDVLAGVAAAGADAPGDEALTQKIDLAAEFRDIGDDEGARSLLEEVMASGNAAQRARAQAMLNELS